MLKVLTTPVASCRCRRLLLLMGVLSMMPSGAFAQRIETSTLAGPASVAPDQALPAPTIQTILVQSALAALNHANLTGDYTVFLKLASTGFRAANTPRQLEQGFRGFRENSVDLSPAVLVPIRWTYAPTLERGTLRLVGVLPTRPQEITFDLGFIAERGRWRIAAVNVNLSAPIAAQSGVPRR